MSRLEGALIEVYILQLRRLPPGETVHPSTVTPTHLGFEEYDIAGTSRFRTTPGCSTANGDLLDPAPLLSPSELDLMARPAGMTLRGRWSDWNREPFPVRADSSCPCGNAGWDRRRWRTDHGADASPSAVGAGARAFGAVRARVDLGAWTSMQPMQPTQVHATHS